MDIYKEYDYIATYHQTIKFLWLVLFVNVIDGCDISKHDNEMEKLKSTKGHTIVEL